MPRTAAAAKPLDQRALEALALRYVERFATSRGRLLDYLRRKVRERGAAAVLDADAVADRMVALGYVDDAAFAEARARGLARRGMGAPRVAMALRQAAIDADRIAVALAQTCPREAALALARRRRIGPFARDVPDERTRERQLAALLRAGHAPRLARAILALAPGEELPDDP